MKDEAETWVHFFAIYDELVSWEIRLSEANETGLLDTVRTLRVDVRREFGAYITRVYPSWTAGTAEDRPVLSTDLVAKYLVPRVGGPLLFVIIDCLRLDQWRMLRPLLGRDFDIEESLYASILPTATPYARNAISAASSRTRSPRGTPAGGQ